MLHRRFVITEPTAGMLCDWCDEPAALCVRAHGEENERACVAHAANLVCYLLSARAAARRRRRDPYGLRRSRKRARSFRRGHAPGDGRVSRAAGRVRGHAARLRLWCGEAFVARRARRIAANRHLPPPPLTKR